jgi:histidinol dehydrogenase
MNAIPAKVAGVEELIMVVPTPNGVIVPLVLAAAHLSGVDSVYPPGTYKPTRSIGVIFCPNIVPLSSL